MKTSKKTMKAIVTIVSIAMMLGAVIAACIVGTGALTDSQDGVITVPDLPVINRPYDTIDELGLDFEAIDELFPQNIEVRYEGNFIFVKDIGASDVYYNSSGVYAVLELVDGYWTADVGGAPESYGWVNMEGSNSGGTVWRVSYSKIGVRDSYVTLANEETGQHVIFSLRGNKIATQYLIDDCRYDDEYVGGVLSTHTVQNFAIDEAYFSVTYGADGEVKYCTLYTDTYYYYFPGQGWSSDWYSYVAVDAPAGYEDKDETYFTEKNACLICQHTTDKEGDRVANCTEVGYCSTCGYEYGKIDPANHTSEPTINATPTEHEITFECCGATVSGEHKDLDVQPEFDLETYAEWSTDLIYEHVNQGYTTYFPRYPENAQKLIASNTVQLPEGEYVLAFNWGINSYHIQYGGFNLLFYHNNELILSRNYTSEPHQSPTEYVEYKFTASEEGDTFTWIFERTSSGTWADETGRMAYLGGICLTGSGVICSDELVCVECGETYQPIRAMAHDEEAGLNDDGMCSNPYCETYESMIEVTAENYEPLGLSEDHIGYYAISRAAHFFDFAKKVKDGIGTINVVLLSDLDLSAFADVSVGTPDNKFSGTFDGNGKTITINTVINANRISLFNLIYNATIRDLTLDGTVTTGSTITAGLVAISSGNCSIERCISKVTIISTVYGDGTHAGFVAANEGMLYLTDCAFVGAIKGEHAYNCGGLVGWTNDDAETHINGCLVLATFEIDSTGSDVIGRNQHRYVVSDTYYVSGALPCELYSPVAMTEEQITSGELAYILSDKGWGQTLGTDPYPVLDGEKVYRVVVSVCGEDSLVYGYTNDIDYVDATTHAYADATCASPKTCVYCSHTEGDVDPDGHVSEAGWFFFDGTRHIYECDLCDYFEYGSHMGGDDSCMPTCEVCDNKYKNTNGKHNAMSDWFLYQFDTTLHARQCFDCGGAFESEAHTGTSATCSEKAYCSVCKSEYGEVDKTAHRSDGGENCADCGEQAFITINGELYPIVGDITNTGIYFNHNDSPAPGAWRAGDGYLVLVVKDSYYADVILYNATIDVSAIENVVAVDIIKDHLDYYVYGTNNIYGNNRNALHNGTVGEDTITNFIIDEDAVLNIYGDCGFDHFILTCGEMNVYGKDVSGDVGIAIRTIKSFTVKEGATLTAVGGKSDSGLTVGVWARKETVIEGVLNSFTVNVVETETNAILTVIANGDVVLNCDTYNAYADYNGYGVILSVPEGASVTVPEGITLNLDSFTSTEIGGELVVEGTIICTHEGGEASCTTLAACDKCKQSYGELDSDAHDMADATCTSPATCASCGHTDGEALGHDWIDATYDAPKTCSVCGKTEGEPLPAETETETLEDETETLEFESETIEGETETLEVESENENENTETEEENTKNPENNGNIGSSGNDENGGGSTDGDKQPQDSGCGSSISIGAVVIAMILGTAFVFRKKE